MTVDELAAQISTLASQLAQRTDLPVTTDSRRALYDLTSALDALRNPLDRLVTHAGEYPDTTTGNELVAPGKHLADTVRALHLLLGRL